MARTQKKGLISKGGKAPRAQLSKSSATQNFEGNVEIAASEFMELYKRTYEETEDIPEPFIFKELTINGNTKNENVLLNIDVKVDVLSSRWITCPVLPSSRDVTVHQSKITAVSRDSGEELSVDNAHLVSLSNINLVAMQSGVYSIQLKVSVPYSSEQKTAFSIPVPETPVNHLLFNLEAGSEISVSPIVGELDREDKEDQSTDIKCEFPATSQLTLQWTKQETTMAPTIDQLSEASVSEGEEEEEASLPRSITVEQNTMHSTGEGVVRTKSRLMFRVLNGTISSSQIEIQNFNRKLTVMSVSLMGGYGKVRKWDVVDSENSNDESAVEYPSRSVKILFDREMEGTFSVHVVTELDMQSTSCKLLLPGISVNNVDRETGDIAVEARTDVEIKEIDRQYIQRVDVEELSHIVKRLAEYKILLAYHFIEVGYNIQLDITKHDDIAVLVACVTEAHYEITRSEDSIMHSMSLLTRNTQKQYLRILLPENSELWSTSVSGQSVKPAKDAETGYLLVPFRSEGKQTQTSEKRVEIVFVVSTSPLDSSGNVEINFPQFDIPVNQLFVSINFPDGYKFGEFDGSLEEVNTFSKPFQTVNSGSKDSPCALQVAPSANNTWAFGGSQQPQQELFDDVGAGGGFGSSQPPMLQQQQQQQQQFYQQAQRYQAPTLERKREKNSNISGTKPVSVGHIDASGQTFRFERLLLVSKEKMNLSVPYARRRKGFMQRRRVTNIRPFLIASSLFISSAIAVGAWWRIRS